MIVNHEKLNNNSNYNTLWDILSLIFIFSFLIIGLVFAFYYSNFIGEANSYIIATISLQQHGSLDIRLEDIETLENEMPNSNVANLVRDKFENSRYYEDVNGKQYPYYMGTYSLSVIPIKAIYTLCNFPYTHIYHVSNVLYYFLALLVVFTFIKLKRNSIFLLISLLVCSPTFLYISWASAEVFICSLIIVSLVFWTNKNHYIAALFASIAATLNIVVCGYVLIIVIDFIIFSCISVRKNTIMQTLIAAFKQLWYNLLLFALCCLPSLLTPIWNIYHYHKITYQIGAASTTLWFNRFLAYFVDLNFGFLPYFPIQLFFLLIIIIVGIINKNRHIIMSTLGFFLTVYLYAAIGHINCGMTAMSRYNAWSFPFIVFIIIYKYEMLYIKSIVRHIATGIIIISIAITSTVVRDVWLLNRGNYTQFTPIARFILSNAPILYNPLPSTYASRTEHVDGGYGLVNSVIPYFNDEGYLRKLYIPTNNSNTIIDDFSGSLDELQSLNESINKIINSNKDYLYINLPNSSIRKREPRYILGEVVSLAGMNSIYQSDGWSKPESWGTWTTGSTTCLKMSLDVEDNLLLHLNIRLLFNSNPVNVYVNDIFAGRYRFKSGDNVVYISKELFPNNNLNIRFEFKDIKSPKDLGKSEDTRKLGIGVESFFIEVEKQ